MIIVHTFKKHWKSILILSGILFFLIIIIIFKIKYPTQYPFKDREILGTTKDEIITIYGDPLGGGDTRIYYDGIKEPYSFAAREVMRNNEVSSETVHYFIYFDESALAYRVEIGLNLGG